MDQCLHQIYGQTFQDWEVFMADTKSEYGEEISKTCDINQRVHHVCIGERGANTILIFNVTQTGGQ
jgi:hypothetical protein